MNILRQLPFAEVPSSIEVAGETIAVRAYQIIVWVSLTADEAHSASAPHFPAILDTGHNHNFSIREGQMLRWAGLRADQCPKVGAILVNRQEIPLRRANLWIHRNRPSTAELLPKPFRLPIPEGVSVYPADSSNAPRLPLMGLRGLVRNGLRLLMEGPQITLGQRRGRGGVK
jgi:hypothetical protein